MTISSSEKQRIDFLLSRDGLEKTIEFVTKTKNIYKTALLHSKKRGYPNPHFATFPMFRRNFILSYLEMKRFLLSQQQQLNRK
jgi:hypothetical protein